MFPSFILALREGIEAALIVGILLGALKKIDREELKKAVWSGVIFGALGSFFTAFVLNSIGAKFEGAGEIIFEGLTMLFAAGMLTWMIFWMQKQGKNLKQELEQEVQTISSQKGKSAIFLLAFTSVLREGIELAIFLLAAQASASSAQIDLGAGLGLGVAALLGWLLFSTTYRLDLREFFRVTNLLLILFAAGLVAHGVHELNEIGWIPALIESVWDINPILSENSTVGLLLKSLFGYNGNPSLTEIMAYLGYFAVLFFSKSINFFGNRKLDNAPAK